MDPLACYIRFCQAINEYDFDEMMAAIDDMRTWLRKHGALPREIPIDPQGWSNLWTMFQKVGVQQTAGDLTMHLVKTDGEHNFWRFECRGDEFWNITPVTQTPPIGGYYNKKYIEKVKGKKFDG